MGGGKDVGDHPARLPGVDRVYRAVAARALAPRQASAPAVAVISVLLVAVAVLAGVVAAVAPAIVEQSAELAEQATAGVVQVRDWLGGPH